MQPSHVVYLPLTPAFFLILIGAFVVLVIIVEFRLLRYAYMQLGVSSRTAVLLLLGSLIGSYFNIPLAEIPDQQVVSGQVAQYFGMQYQGPAAADSSTTIVAINVGGAVIPIIMSFYLLRHYDLWRKGAIATAGVAAVCYLLATPLPGIGIAIPVFVPVIATTIIALILDRDLIAPLAYIAGSLGTLIGADLMNLGKVAGLGAPVASIGGAGTFDGIFVTGIVAVLIGSLVSRRAPEAAQS
jgi:uncharacterized membrane protein